MRQIESPKDMVLFLYDPSAEVGESQCFGSSGERERFGGNPTRKMSVRTAYPEDIEVDINHDTEARGTKT
jgi:hypothetical protein